MLVKSMPRETCGPISSATPPRPSTAPTIRTGVSFSSRLIHGATNAAKIGVDALKIDASPLSMCFSPSTIRLNGITLLIAPSTKNASSTRGSRGMGRPVATTTASSTSAAGATRPNTIVNGGNPASSSTL